MNATHISVVLLQWGQLIKVLVSSWKNVLLKTTCATTDDVTLLCDFQSSFHRQTDVILWSLRAIWHDNQEFNRGSTIALNILDSAIGMFQLILSGLVPTMDACWSQARCEKSSYSVGPYHCLEMNIKNYFQSQMLGSETKHPPEMKSVREPNFKILGTSYWGCWLQHYTPKRWFDFTLLRLGLEQGTQCINTNSSLSYHFAPNTIQTMVWFIT